MRRFTNSYNLDGKEKRRQAREAAGNKCIRCGSPSVPGRILTTHHFDGDKSNDAWYNLLALCQRCHLHIQGKVDPETPFFLEHSEWLKPFVGGFLAKKYLGLDLEKYKVILFIDELTHIEQRSCQKDFREYMSILRSKILSANVLHEKGTREILLQKMQDDSPDKHRHGPIFGQGVRENDARPKTEIRASYDNGEVARNVIKAQ